MRWYEAAGVGAIMGCLYGLVLWASMINLALLSFMRFGDQFYLPFRVTAAVILTAFLALFTVPMWYPVAERWILETGREIAEAREIDKDDDE
jgi:Mg/Co/Ni transporter MgtE